jgi:alpha-D-ribose 1-methylphosphonate 5-triphosphate synthase subunit PhnH
MSSQTYASSAASTARILPAFDEPVIGAQITFRSALEALSRPGLIQQVCAPVGRPDALSVATTALLLTLADNDTPVWLPQNISEEAKRYLRFHCGCPLTTAPSAARFVVTPAGFESPLVSDCHAGEAEYPDRSATLLLEVATLEDGPVVQLAGPGIKTCQALAVGGLAPGFWKQWRENQKRFPLGVDVFFIHGDRFCALPRTTRVEEL